MTVGNTKSKIMQGLLTFKITDKTKKDIHINPTNTEDLKLKQIKLPNSKGHLQ
jgi:hypothetical protein